MIRASALAIVLCLALQGCALMQGGGSKAVEAVACVVSDDRLSVAFKNPKAARAYIEKLTQRADGGDDSAVRELIDLMLDISGCIK